MTNNSIESSLGEPFRSGRFSDLKVVCGSDTYAVHKVILCTQCEFFDNAIKFKEGIDGTIELPADDPAAVKAMLEFYYTRTYTTGAQDENLLLLHIKVYTIACKYLIEGLQILASERYVPRVKLDWDKPIFVSAVRAIFGGSIPDGFELLRPATIRISHKNLKKLIQKPEFIAAIAEVGKFAQTLVVFMGKYVCPIILDRKFECYSCGSVFGMNRTLDHISTRSCLHCGHKVGKPRHNYEIMD